MSATFHVRLATQADIPALHALIESSVRILQANDYTPAQIEGALGTVLGLDTQLLADQTYFVAETTDSSGTKTIVACGGWSKRKTLFGSDHQTNRDDAGLNPTSDAARIRAFFVHPAWARHGIARAILEECERAIRVATFKSIELAATLPGVPFYGACGYTAGERLVVSLPNKLNLPIVRMTKDLR